MKYCFHYQFDEDNKKYVSLAIRYIGDKDPYEVHKFKCKRCGLLLHDIDIRNLNNKINDMNKGITGNDNTFPFVDISDIHNMLAPVPYVYDEDSKYRDNQLR